MSDEDAPFGDGEGPAPAAPAGFPPPAPEDLLGLRIAAALIDLVVLAGLLVILGVSVGQATVSGGSFNVSLSGAWTGVFLAVALGYYFVLEAWAGQTLGKRLLGLRVHRAAGTRPSVGAVALRTLLRIVDWLPLLYLAGFITMLATGTRRQRIGDLAAGTVVARAVPVRGRGLALVPLAIVVVAAVALSVYRATSAAGSQTYQGHGVSFSYPAGWSADESPQVNTTVGNLLWSTAVGPGTPDDLIIAEAYRLKLPVMAQNIDALIPSMAGVLQQAGATIQGTPKKTPMGGLPAVQFQGTGTTGGSHYKTTITFAFNGTTEYFVNCQYTPAQAAEVQKACNQVIGSFHAA